MGGVRKFILALALVLATAAATPALAVDVAGTSARLRWTPASGPVAAYAVWMIRQGAPAPATPATATLTNEVTLRGVVGDAFQVQVAALDARGVLGPRSPLSAPIRFVATPSPTSGPRLVLSTQSVSLTATRGGAAAPARISITNGGGGSLTWKAVGSARWLVLGPAAQGGAPASLEIGAAAWGLPLGIYHATVTVAPTGAAGSPQSIQVALTVQARRGRRPGPQAGTPSGPAAAQATMSSAATSLAAASSDIAPPSAQEAALEVSTLGLSLSATVGQSPPAQSFSVRNAGSGTLAYSVTPEAAWLTVSPAGGTSQGEADSIRVSSANLSVGTHRGSILVSAPGLPSARVAVTVVVSGTQAPVRARPYDLDGDGHADLLLRDASGAYQVTLLGDSGPIARSALGTAPPAGATLAGSGDLDADGKADLIWNDPAAGALQLWLMNGARAAATRALPLGGRSLLAIADFDGDGKADLLLDAGASLELWHMDGLQVGSITTGITGLGVGRVVTARDLDGDGRADLLVATESASTTSYAALSLAGTRLVTLLPLPAPAKSLALVTAGACGAGGAPGILWRDSLTGGLVLWTLGRQGLTNQATVDVALPLEWELSATADFSGDGRTDLLVRHGSTGPLVVLALDGRSLVGGFQVEDALAPGLQILNR